MLVGSYLGISIIFNMTKSLPINVAFYIAASFIFLVTCVLFFTLREPKKKI